jgi:predicted double-glycine peptidase
VLAKQELAKIETRIDSSGICRQSLDYTCGPAAAVTAVRKLGLEAEESEIAILAKSNPITGTLPLNLFYALKKRYSDEGLRCSFRMLDSVKQFQNSGLILTVVRDSFLRDHCVVVMKVSNDKVLLADPSFGRVLMSLSQFEKVWRHNSIIITLEPEGTNTKTGAI